MDLCWLRQLESVDGSTACAATKSSLLTNSDIDHFRRLPSSHFVLKSSSMWHCQDIFGGNAGFWSPYQYRWQYIRQQRMYISYLPSFGIRVVIVLKRFSLQNVPCAHPLNEVESSVRLLRFSWSGNPVPSAYDAVANHSGMSQITC